MARRETYSERQAREARQAKQLADRIVRDEFRMHDVLLSFIPFNFTPRKDRRS